MGNSFKQWHKLVLVVCTVLVFLGSAAGVQAQGPDLYFTELQAALNAFNTDGDRLLEGYEFWTDKAGTGWGNYQIQVFDAFSVGAGPSNPLTGLIQGPLVDSINKQTVALPSPVSLSHGQDYYVWLKLDTVSYGIVYSYDLGVSYLEAEGTGWEDLGSSGYNFLMTPITVPVFDDDNIWVNDTRGNWSIADDYVPPATLDVQITATDLGPFDVEIGVTGEMDTALVPGMEFIYANGTLENASGMDWTGLGVQLGYGLGDDFVLATDGLAIFDGSAFHTEVYFDDLIANGAIENEFFPIRLPDGRDDPFFFTMRVYAVPEPGSLLLLGLASLVLLAFGRPRR